MKDYCLYETLETRCAGDEVEMLMESAVNGRMQYGRCIERDYGYVGCHKDVLHLADARCSGRRQCKIEMPDKIFNMATPNCPRDLTLFLSASYTCLKGIYITLRYVTLRYGTVRYGTLRYVTLRYATLRYVTLRYATGSHTW